MEIRSRVLESTQHECANETQVPWLLSFPLFRPFEVCIASRTQEARAAVPAVAGDVAQLGEHLLCTQGVTGSSPVISTRTLSTE